jgi:hypothetical protein
MNRKEFNQYLGPLAEKLYSFAHALVPDDLQAEQLVIDSVNAYLLKERKTLLNRKADLKNKKNIQLIRRSLMKSVLRHMADIGCRRAHQLMNMRMNRYSEFTAFYNLEPEARMVLKLRYEAQFAVEEIEEIMQLARYQVIEKIHNGRFLIVNDLNKGVEL